MIFWRIFRGSSEIVDFGFFYDFRQFSGDPPEFIKIPLFDIFQAIGDLIECAGAGPLQNVTKLLLLMMFQYFRDRQS